MMDYHFFEGAEKDLIRHGIMHSPALRFQLDNAADVLEAAMKYFIGENLTWLPEYNEIAQWLSDTQGKGLTLYGSNGVGKTVLCKQAIPIILLKGFRKVAAYYNYYELNAKADEILAKKIVAIDDFGNEEQASIYGNKRWILSEVVDNAEKQNNLLILTTNFNGDDLIKKYGSRTFDRIVATTRRIKINHESFRK